LWDGRGVSGFVMFYIKILIFFYLLVVRGQECQFFRYIKYERPLIV